MQINFLVATVIKQIKDKDLWGKIGRKTNYKSFVFIVFLETFNIMILIKTSDVSTAIFVAKRLIFVDSS